jgi:broad specificity phosphatase PhoE
MDELSFGREPRRSRKLGEPGEPGEPGERRQSPRRRAFPAAASLALAAAAGVALVVTHGATSQHPVSQPAASPGLLSHLPPKGCPPANPAWPTLTSLPAGMRPGALPVIVAAQFSGGCATP